jgi:hypothetical protein
MGQCPHEVGPFSVLTVSKTAESIRALPDFLVFLLPAKKLPKKDPFSEVGEFWLAVLADRDGDWCGAWLLLEGFPCSVVLG